MDDTPSDLFEDMATLNALYEELMWDHKDILEFSADYDNNQIIIRNKTQEGHNIRQIEINIGRINFFMNGRLSKVDMTNKLMQLKRELDYKCEIGEMGEWECNGANKYMHKVFNVLDEYWQQLDKKCKVVLR